MRPVIYPIFAIALAGNVACTNMSTAEQGTLSGTDLGAAAGAGISAIAGGDAGVGALVGGALGGVAGNMKARNERSY
jgi:hypothetical protein